MLKALLKEFLEEFLDQAAPAEVRKRMEKAVPGIVAGMTAKGMTPDRAALDLVSRDALFRLWRSVIPSGDVADFIRDRQEAKVVPLALQGLPDEPSLQQVVLATLEALMDVTF